MLDVRVRRRRQSRFPHLLHSAHLSRSGISISRQSCDPIRQRQSLAMTAPPQVLRSSTRPGCETGMQNMCRPYGIAGPWLAPARSAACHAARGFESPSSTVTGSIERGEAQPGIFQAPGGHQGGVRFFSIWSPWLLQLVDVCLHQRHQMTSTTWNGAGRQRRAGLRAAFGGDAHAAVPASAGHGSAGPG